MSVLWVLNGGSYDVSSKEHLLQIMSSGTTFTDTGDSPVSYLSSSYIQTGDIDLDSEVVTPIGTSASPFTGTYDGSSFSISNWSYSGSIAYVGLFGFSTGTIKNLLLNGVWSLTATATTASGCLVGEVDGGSVFNIDSLFDSGTSMVFTGGTSGGIIGITRNSCIIQGITLGGTISTFSSANSAGGVFGACVSNSTIYFARNIATFETDLVANNASGVSNNFQDSNVSYVMNAMIGDISATNSAAGISASLGIGSSNSCDVLVNSMKGNIIGGSGSRNGGIASTLTGRFSTGVFNRLVNYMEGDITVGTRGGISGVTQIFGTSGVVNMTNCMVATNGSINNVNYGSDLNPGDTTYNVKRDSAFGMTFSGSSDSSTSASLTGFTTHPEFTDLPYIPFIGTDNEGNTYNWEFIFPNVSGNASYSAYTDLAISAGDVRQPLEIDFDLLESNTTQYASFIDTSVPEAFVDGSLVVLNSSATTVYDYAGTEQLFPSLITATIFTHMVDLSWNAVSGASTYTVDYTEDAGADIRAVTDTTELSITIFNLNPGSSYVFNVYSDLDLVTPIRTITVSSPTVSTESVSALLVRISNNLELIGEAAVSDITGTLTDVLTTGDTVDTEVGLSTFVQDSDTIQLSSDIILTPFDQGSGTGQTFTLVLPPDATTYSILYDETSNSVTYESVNYAVGDFFVIGAYKISVKSLV